MFKDNWKIVYDTRREEVHTTYLDTYIGRYKVNLGTLITITTKINYKNYRVPIKILSWYW